MSKLSVEQTAVLRETVSNLSGRYAARVAEARTSGLDVSVTLELLTDGQQIDVRPFSVSHLDDGNVLGLSEYLRSEIRKATTATPP